MLRRWITPARKIINPTMHASNQTCLNLTAGIQCCSRYQSYKIIKMNSKELYARLLRYVQPYWKLFVLAILTMIALSATQPLLPILLKPLLDESFVAKNLQSISLMPLLFVLLFVARGLLTVISTLAMTSVSSRVVMDIRHDMFNKILTLPSHTIDKQPSGNLLSKLTFNVSLVTTACTNALVILVQDSLTIAGLLAWMFYLDWKLSLVFFLVFPGAAFIIKLASGRIRKLSHSLQDSMGNMTQVLQEAISGIKVIKIFGGEKYEKNRFQGVNNWVRRLTIKIKTASSVNVAAVEILSSIALALIIYMAALKSANNEITVGSFISFFAAMAMLFAPTKRLTKVNEELQRGLAAAESIFDLLDESNEDDQGTTTLDQSTGKLEFKNLSFHYPQAKHDVLKNINLTINPGETIALVGQSGSGKTTLVSLIPRFYEATQGEILLDQINITELTIASLRQQIALVSQDIILFDDTLLANIAYGNMQNATEEQIMAAAKAAHVVEFVEKLPDGLQTRVGENGVSLSGGQRQRVAIARALLKDAPILIFDEATSALDTKSEFYVQDAMDKLRKDRTTIIIAHRLSTVKNANRIIVMDQGEIAETGNHQSLMDANGLYAKLQQMQTR